MNRARHLTEISLRELSALKTAVVSPEFATTLLLIIRTDEYDEMSRNRFPAIRYTTFVYRGEYEDGKYLNNNRREPSISLNIPIIRAGVVSYEVIIKFYARISIWRTGDKVYIN